VIVYKNCDILLLVVIMKIFRLSIICLLFFALNSCETINKKSQEAIDKENKKLSKFIQQSESKLKIEMGKPDKVVNDDKGFKFLIYKKKKYSITCERKFEIDKNKVVVGFESKGCF